MSNAPSEPAACPSCRACLSPASPVAVCRHCGAAGRSRAPGLRPLPGAVLVPVLLALVALSPAAASSLRRAPDGRRATQAQAAAPKARRASTPGKPKAAHAAPPREVPNYDWDYEAEAAAFRLLRKTERITNHPENATQAQLVQAARDLVRANELSYDFELQPWFHARLGTVLYARAKATRGPERTALLERARVHFYLAALTHWMPIGRADASDVWDYPAASVAASFILYHAGLLQYELGRPSEAEIPLDLLLKAAADHESDLKRPEYVQKARTLLAKIKQAAVAAPKTPPASKQSKPKSAKTAEVKPLDEAAALRLLRKAEAITKHPEKATPPQLVQAAHDLALAAELSPDFQLEPWFHADLGTALYARAKAKQGRERRHLLHKSAAQFELAAFTHGIDVPGGNGSTAPRDLTDYEEAGDATVAFIFYHLGLLHYELGTPSAALFPLQRLLDAAADHPLQRPEYVQKARTLLADATRAYEKQQESERSRP